MPFCALTPKHSVHELSLRGCRPDPLPGSLGKTKAGAVYGDDPVSFRKLVEQPADHKVLCHRVVAVEQDHGSALGTRDVMNANAVDFGEPALGRGGAMAARSGTERYRTLLLAKCALRDYS